jgi:hypothetical protein
MKILLMNLTFGILNFHVTVSAVVKASDPGAVINGLRAAVEESLECFRKAAGRL